MQKIVPNYRIYGEFDADFSLNPVHVDDVRRSAEENDWYISPHRHDDLCHLVYFFSGAAIMYREGQSVSLSAPCFCVVPAGVVHGFRVQENIEGAIVTLSNAYMERILEGADGHIQLMNNYFLIQEDQSDFFRGIAPLYKQLSTEYTGRQIGRDLSIRSLLGLVFSYLAREVLSNNSASVSQSDEDKNLWYYRQFQNLIGYALAEKKPVTAYAAELRISVTHLNRICQSVAGQSALKVIHDRVISEAKINLVYTFQSVSEVAYKLGFDDVSYFSRFFKNQTGLSPRAFKEGFRSYS